LEYFQTIVDLLEVSLLTRRSANYDASEKQPFELENSFEIFSELLLLWDKKQISENFRNMFFYQTIETHDRLNNKWKPENEYIDYCNFFQVEKKILV